MGLPAISLGATGIGAVFSAIGAGQQASATSANAAYQAAVAKNNQIIAEQNASLATQAGEERATTQSLRNAAQLGRIIVGQAANNIDINTGSPVDVRASQQRIGQLDTMTTLQNAQLQAYGYRSMATNYGAQSQLSSAEAAQAQQAGGLGVASSLIGGAGQLSNRFLWMQLYGKPGGGAMPDFADIGGEPGTFSF